MPTDDTASRGRRYGVARRERVPTDGEWVQLATRIPKRLRRELRLFCVEAEMPVMQFVVDALAEKLARVAGTRSER